MINPLPGWVLIEPIEDKNEVVDGIKLPDSTQDYPMRGKILGQTRIEGSMWFHESGELVNTNTEVGDVVFFKKFSGQDIKHEGKEYKLVEFKDLLAVVE